MLKAVGLFYPGPPEVAYSSLAFHMIGNYIEEVLKVPVYRYFLDKDEIVSFDRAPDPSRIKVLFVSVSFELLYPTVARMLHLAGIPPLADKRKFPIVIGGGPPLSANPLPLTDILDVVIIGEAEPILDELISLVDCESSKERCLEKISGRRGVFLTKRPSLTRKVYVKNLDDSWHPTKLYLKKQVEPIWGKSYLLETSRGCGRGCRFCMEGYIFRPPRHRSLAVLKSLLVEGIKVNNLNKVSFYSLSFFDNPEAEDLLAFAVEDLGLEVSVPSMRVETLTRERLRLIAKGDQRTLSIAPETGSCRIGRAFKKCIEKDVVLNVVEEALEAGIRSIKLYMITAIPGEDKNDVEETLELIETILKKVRSRGALLKVSANPLIPKPHTPLQWLGFDRGFAEKKLKEFSRHLRKKGVDVRIYGSRHAQIQALLALGDQRLSKAIMEWGIKGGGVATFNAILRREGLNVESYLSFKDPSYEPPWHRYVIIDFADVNLLRLEFKAFLKALSLDNTEWYRGDIRER